MNKVGKRTLLLEDKNRPNWAGPGNRPLLTEIWYPASDDAVTETFKFGSPEARFQFDAIALDGVIKEQSSKYPLVLLSHGTGGSALGMGWLGQYLASQGYITAAVNHHGNNAIEPYLAHGFMLWWERATDFSVLLDQLLSEVDWFKDKIDRHRIGVAGFSLGGCTSILLSGGRCDLGHKKTGSDRGHSGRLIAVSRYIRRV
jgi:predicted dienelactone hydrolase